MVALASMQAVILAGGLGTRLSEMTGLRPKPMVEVGPWPILRHIMEVYSHHGVDEFVVALGYLGDVIKRYFQDMVDLDGDVTLDLGARRVDRHGSRLPSWRIHLVETGLHTQTAGRLLALAPRLAGGPFMLTYGDGLSNVDVGALLAFHKAQGKLATITAVRPPARFGALTLEEGRVAAFVEKTQLAEGWINGGFMVLEPGVLAYLKSPEQVLERDVLPVLAAQGQLAAFRHEGYWQCMDTVRDLKMLQEQWDSGAPAWMVRP